MKVIAVERIEDLRPGDIAQNLHSGNAYVVVSSNGSTAAVVRAIEVTNSDEWQFTRLTTG